MQHRFSRTELLIGPAGLAKLARSTVAVFGVGGVGSYAVEALARSGVGRLVLIDYDDICLTNVNRQIHALTSTVGQHKVTVMKQRILDINPACQVETIREFYSPAERSRLVRPDYTYIVDAIDTITAKVDLIAAARSLGIPVVSCMGAGNRLDPTKLQVADISITHGCPMAKAVRKGLRQVGITSGVKVVFSPEPPRTPLASVTTCCTGCICPHPAGRFNCARRRQIPGSIVFVPAVAGLLLAGVVVNDILAAQSETGENKNVAGQHGGGELVNNGEG